jgi:uncharacterized membrane protein YebE (DUF533 family)
MSYLKIIGGAAIGVGAVAAAPFTGGGSLLAAAGIASSLAGAGTIATAAGAGAIGAVAGKALSNKEKNELQKKLGAQKAKYELEKKKIVKKVERILKDTTKIYEYVIAMHAIGMATANADGHISQEEVKEIEEFVNGVMSASFPDTVKKQIKDLTDNPPSLSTAYAFLKKAGMTEKGWKDVDDLIQIVIDADGYEDEKEKKFKESWQILRKAA